MLTKTIASIGNVVDAAMRFLHGTRNLAAGGVAIATTKTKLKTVNALSYTIGGLIYAKAATDNLFTHAASNAIQAAGTTCYYVATIDAAGNGAIVQGDYNSLPPVTACPVAIMKVVTDGVTTFTPGTTAHDAAGITVTVTDIGSIPVALP